MATQQDRASHFDRYVTALAQMPFLVGFHWFEFTDEPAEGRFDGENSNYGLVNIKDEPWQVLVERMTQVKRPGRNSSNSASKASPDALRLKGWTWTGAELRDDSERGVVAKRQRRLIDRYRNHESTPHP